MKTVVVTGSAGLIGSECVKRFAGEGFKVVGIDNDLRKWFFGEEASTRTNLSRLIQNVPKYEHRDFDIRNADAVEGLFRELGSQIVLVVHTAAQPSHDWAARDPEADFTVNANGTLNLLEAARRNCPGASFVFTSTSKVYGDRPNELPMVEQELRWELSPEPPFATHGIDESMGVDACLHSLFGASKLAADIVVQEYGRYFGMRTACFRGGCLTGPAHSGTMLHGFLAYLTKCAVSGAPYTVLGYKGKQVRDNIHSYDLVNAFWHFIQAPRSGAVYNIGGSRHADCSVMEAIAACERLTGRAMNWSYSEQNRTGDHIWWISDVRRFQNDYPQWRYRYNIEAIIAELIDARSWRQISMGDD